MQIKTKKIQKEIPYEYVLLDLESELIAVPPDDDDPETSCFCLMIRPNKKKPVGYLNVDSETLKELRANIDDLITIVEEFESKGGNS